MDVIKRPDSSNISEVSYNDDTQEMYIKFKSGGYYKYSTVPKHVFSSFENVASAGKYFASQVKGKYPYKRIHR